MPGERASALSESEGHLAQFQLVTDWFERGVTEDVPRLFIDEFGKASQRGLESRTRTSNSSSAERVSSEGSSGNRLAS